MSLAAWDADPADIHATLTKKASENSSGQEGRRSLWIDLGGLHYRGFTTTQTLDAPSANMSTDRVVDTDWQYDIALNDVYLRDHTLTSVNGS